MIIKASAAMRNDYTSISDPAKETKEPIYITENGKGDLVLMSIDASERREERLRLRERCCRQSRSAWTEPNPSA